MKQFVKKIGLLVAMLLTILLAHGYDFEVDGIYYKITSMSELEVEVSSNGDYEVWSNGCKNKTPYTGDVTIPSTVNFNNRTFTVTGIGKAAFGYPCRNLDEAYATSYGTPTNVSSVVLPPTIRYIDAMAFQGCNIQSIQLPNSLTSIGIAAFAYTKLQEIQIPSSVEKIQKEAFYASNITSVTLGENVSEISDKAFRSCSSLMEVFCTSSSKPNGLSMNTFKDAHSALEIYVPSYATYGLGKEYLSFPNRTFQYSGLSNSIEWRNNLKAYKCEISESDCKTEINAGAYTKRLLAKYSNGVDFSVEIPYEYTISKAPMSLTVNDIQREYGDRNPAFTCKISGFVNGENEQTLGATPSFECEATPFSNVGSYRILASLNAPNYEISYKYGNLSILKAPLSVSVVNSTKIYGEENPKFALSYTGLKNDETSPDWIVKPQFTTTADSRSSVGEYTVTANGGDANNYEIKSYASGLLTIIKKDLTVKADDYERLYGEINPVFSISYVGFVNNDSKTSLLSVPKAECVATKESDSGTYAITVSGGSAENYRFVYLDGRLVIKPLTVGFKDIYNSVTCNDMSVSTSDDYFNFIPEIIGPFSEDDFWIGLLYLDGDNRSQNHVLTITGGEYAGKYLDTNIDRAMWAGKYIFNLMSKGTNPNVVANPSRAYLTVNRASNNLEWNTSSPIKVKMGEKIDLGITYQADIWCRFNTDFDEEIISLSSVEATGNDPHWFATGLKEGETTLSFSIECQKNEMGFYDFSDSRTISKRIIVEPSSGIEGIVSDDNDITIKVLDGQIVVNEISINSTIRVFNLQGCLLVETKEPIIDGLSKGIYIVTVGGKSYKVVI